MRDVIVGLKNHNTHEAKDFVVPRIVGEAPGKGTILASGSLATNTVST